MGKSLTEMSLEELWQLFPIFLVKHKKEWSSWFKQESENIKSILPYGIIKRISHIGSTAIPNIKAKNIVDILLEVNDEKDIHKAKHILMKNNWLVMNEKPNRVSMNKGYTPNGFADKVFHLHIRTLGDNEELYFRDYLTENPEIAKEYEKLKVDLKEKFEHDRDMYTIGKSDFIKKYTSIAKKSYKNKYEKGLE